MSYYYMENFNLSLFPGSASKGPGQLSMMPDSLSWTDGNLSHSISHRINTNFELGADIKPQLQVCLCSSKEIRGTRKQSFQ